MRFLYNGGKVYNEIYRDQPIRPRYGYPIPEQIRSMRALQKQDEKLGTARNQSFFKAARLMAGYEDDFRYDKVVSRHNPAYDSLSDVELRGYFGWRTRYKRGEDEPAGSYAEIYLSELLNGIGINDPMDGYERIAELKRRCGEYIPNIDKLIADYVICNDLPSDLINSGKLYETDRYILLLTGEIKADDLSRLEAMIELSGYQELRKSQLYTDGRNDLAAVMNRCFDRVGSYSEQKRGKSFFTEICGRAAVWPYALFSGAVVYSSGRVEGYTYNINAVRSVYYKNGHWSVRRYSPDEGAKTKFKSFIRDVCTIIINRYGINSDADPVSDHSGLENNDTGVGTSDKPVYRLKAPVWMKKLMEDECRLYFDEKRLAEERKVRIDYSKLDAIRESAASVRDRLIVDENDVETPSQEALNGTDVFYAAGFGKKGEEQQVGSFVAGYRGEREEQEEHFVAGSGKESKERIFGFAEESGGEREERIVGFAEGSGGEREEQVDGVTEGSEEESVEQTGNRAADRPEHSITAEGIVEEPPDEARLSDIEKRTLLAIINDEELGFVKENGFMLSIVVDSINEKLFDIFGDNVIYDDGKPQIYDDYIDELKELL